MPYRDPSDPRPRLPLLARLAVKTPCTAKWEDMVGSDTARFCCTCSKTVYDLSAMEAADAEAFLAQYIDAAPGEMPCTRFYRRADGRILTAECAPAARKRHALKAAKTIATTLAVATLATAMADLATRPTLAVDDDARPLDRDQVLVMVAGAADWGASIDDDDGVERIDEVAIAEAFEPESEVLGTAARTMRAVDERRPKDVVLSGTVKLVSPPR